jgi:Spy/CpxP family protein refolding chaperone
MKNLKIITLLILFLSTATFAQQGGRMKERLQQKKEQLKSMKIAFITTELNLTPDEATKFWPLFNAFEDKQRELKQERIKNYMDRIDSDKLSEKEATTLLTQMENTEDELFQSRKKFIANLKGVLPAVKILKLKKAEEEFSKKLLQQYRDKKMAR